MVTFDVSPDPVVPITALENVLSAYTGRIFRVMVKIPEKESIRGIILARDRDFIVVNPVSSYRSPSGGYTKTNITRIIAIHNITEIIVESC